MTGNAAPTKNRLRSIVMSELLKAEHSGKPIEYARYCAKYPRRKETLSTLNNDHLIYYYGNNTLGLTFNGLVSARSSLASKVLADCRSIYNLMRDHYKKHIHEKRPSIAELLKTFKPLMSIEHAIFAVSMLVRESGANLVVELPVTAESKLQGNQDLLEKSFTRRVRDRRILLTKPHLEVSRPWNPQFGHGLENSRDSSWLFALLAEVGSEEVQEEWRKCNARGASEPDGAISAAKTLLESVCKQVLGGREIAYSPTATLPELYGLVRRELQFDPGKAPNRALQTIFQGCTAVVSGLAELRNTMGDGHGKAPGSPKTSNRHSRLAVAMSGAMASFLITADDARKMP